MRRLEKIERRLKRDVPTVQLRDQVLFSIGIFWLVLGTWWLTRFPHTFPLAHFVAFPFVFSWLIYSYIFRPKRNWGLFLLDFCYFANWLTWVLTFARLSGALNFPQSPTHDTLFAVVFALNTGPLLMANLPWRISLVFHSPDKMCSEFIHTVPSLAVFAHRWFSSPSFEGGGDVPEESFMPSLIYPFLAYLFWQLTYLVLTESRYGFKHLADSPVYSSSLRHQVTSFNKSIKVGGGGVIFVLAKWFGVLKGGVLDPDSSHTKVFFMAVQAMYTLCTLAIAAAAWHSFWANCAILFCVWVHTVFQGAGFYVRVFSARYMDEIKASVDEVAKVFRSSSTPMERCSGAAALPEPSTKID